MKMTAIVRASGMVLAGVLMTGALAAPAHADQTDDAFINLLNQRGVPYDSPAEAIRLAKSTCNILGKPGGKQVERAIKNAQTKSGLPIEQLQYLIGGAVAAYCPDEKLY